MYTSDGLTFYCSKDTAQFAQQGGVSIADYVSFFLDWLTDGLQVETGYSSSAYQLQKSEMPVLVPNGWTAISCCELYGGEAVFPARKRMALW